jgi:hypothetical protein
VVLGFIGYLIREIAPGGGSFQEKLEHAERFGKLGPKHGEGGQVTRNTGSESRLASALR